MLTNEPLSFRAFISIMRPGYVWTKFHALLADALQATFEGKILRLGVSVPPRHGKSNQISELFAPYCFGRSPIEQIMAISHAASLAHDFGGKARDLMASKQYLDLFPWAEIPGDGRTGAGWKLETIDCLFDKYGDALVAQMPSHVLDLLHLYKGFGRGAYTATGVDGSTVGKAATLGLVDDPIKNRKQAESPRYIAGLHSWFGADFYTRLEPGARVVVVHTRWNNNDLIGHIKTHYNDDNSWVFLSFSAIAEEDDILGREPGEALFPEKYPIKALEKIRKSKPKADWEALYQQNPDKGSGSLWKPSHARIVPKADIKRSRTLLARIASWDCASSLSSTADFTGFAMFELFTDGTLLLTGAEKNRLEFSELLEHFKAAKDICRADVQLVEKASNGIALLQHLPNNLPKYAKNVFAVSAHTDKQLEMNLALQMFESGKVFIADDCPNLDEVLDQLAQHPFGQQTDISIAIVQAVRWVQMTDIPALKLGKVNSARQSIVVKRAGRQKLQEKWR